MTTKQSSPWLLPEGIEEILPPEATRLEEICRGMIDTFQSWGYQLVIPPMIEYLDSLLTGTGEDLELQTFKLTDLLTGRMMGVRADTTPQVARIDAHHLKRDVPTRLCYLGTVLHTKPVSSGGTRSPMQVGAELYGHKGIESDVEIICLMLTTLNSIGINNLHIDLGHVGIYKALVDQAKLNTEQETSLFDILQRKAKPELLAQVDDWSLSDNLLSAFLALMDLNGGVDVLDQAEDSFTGLGDKVKNCIAELKDLNQQVKQRISDAPLFFDLAELRGYHYHTGVTFAAYVPGKGSGIAFGGRYDDVGKSFGRARAATGFSTDIKALMNLLPQGGNDKKGIFAPWQQDENLAKKVEELRQQGEIVINALPGQTGGANVMECDRQLVEEAGQWLVKTL